MKVKINQAASMIITLIKAKLVPLLVGSPGTGKSQIYQSIADTHNLKLIDVRLSQCDVVDLNGFPNLKGEKAYYLPMDIFPVEGDPIPEGYVGWLILFDELTSAPRDIQAASYKIILDRMVGMHKLHKNVAVCAAGNLETDNAIVESMSTALQSRMVHLELEVCVKEWANWAINSAKIDRRIVDFMEFRPGLIYTFKPDHTDNTYACPRTWQFADRILKLIDITNDDALPLLAGTLSEGVAREFLMFCSLYNDLPKMKDIIANPMGTRVPDAEERGQLFATCGAISHHATSENIPDLLKYVERFPKDMQIVAARMIIARNQDLVKVPEFILWYTKFAAYLYK